MKYEIAEKFNSEINSATNEWETIRRSFNDEKSAEFEAKLFSPLIEEARRAVQFFHIIETEIMNAERHINIPVP